jgi:hypothetical protein
MTSCLATAYSFCQIPARTVDELQLMVKKIIAYEKRPWTTEDLRLPVWIGNPMASPVFNRMATGFVVSQARAHSPKWGEVSFICGDINSPFCGWPPSQAATFHRWLKRGGVFATIGAHGSEYSWYSVVDNGRWVTYDVREQSGALQQGTPTCPLFVFTCDSGNFATEGRSVTEAMVLAPGGPVAAVGATTESHPLPNNYTIRGLQHALQNSPERLGDLWVQALRRGYETSDIVLKSLLKDLEGSLEEHIDVAKLRRDQLRMYALIGDPAVRIRIPRKLDATILRTEKGWEWSVRRPDDATTLHVHLRTNDFNLPVRKSDVDQLNATKLHMEANQLFAYETMQKLTKEQNWVGVTNEVGELRLVAMAPSGWYAAVLKAGD